MCAVCPKWAFAHFQRLNCGKTFSFWFFFSWLLHVLFGCFCTKANHCLALLARVISIIWVNMQHFPICSTFECAPPPAKRFLCGFFSLNKSSSRLKNISHKMVLYWRTKILSKVLLNAQKPMQTNHLLLKLTQVWIERIEFHWFTGQGLFISTNYHSNQFYCLEFNKCRE